MKAHSAIGHVPTWDEPAGGPKHIPGKEGNSGCQIKCVVPFFGVGVMVEKCRGQRSWRVIGVCVGSSF